MADLRQRAEALMQTYSDETPAIARSADKKLLHELQVHQVELEMQNEELLRAQVDLAHSRDAYAELYDFAPVGYLTVNRAGKILEMNHTATLVLGVEPRNLIGRKFSDFVHRDSQDSWFRLRRLVIASEETQGLDLELHQADKTAMTARIECRPRPGATADELRILLVFIDITYSKRVERAARHLNDRLELRIESQTTELAESEARFKSIFEEARDGIVLIDPMTQAIRLANRAASETLGYAEGELANVGLAEISTNSESFSVEAEFEALLRGESRSTREIWVKRRDGSAICVEVNGFPIAIKGKRYLAGIFRNVSQRKIAEQRETRQAARLRQLASSLASAQDEEQRRIAEGLHESVSQWLFASQIKLNLLQHYCSSEQADPLVAEIGYMLTKAAEEIRTLCFNLGSSVLHKLGLKAGLKDLCQVISRQHGIQVALICEHVPSDIGQELSIILFKATRELLFNVVKHAGSNEAHVYLLVQDAEVIVIVEDNGRGFGEGHHSSTGLGLFAIQERIRDVGGTMSLESVPGGTTKVTLRAPLKSPTEPRDPSAGNGHP